LAHAGAVGSDLEWRVRRPLTPGLLASTIPPGVRGIEEL
jgi:hypothetical protein